MKGTKDRLKEMIHRLAKMKDGSPQFKDQMERIKVLKETGRLKMKKKAKGD